MLGLEDAQALLVANQRTTDMDDRQSELEEFKRRINLSEYAAAQGYDVDRRASSRNSVGMAHSDGDKIIIGMGHDEHWVYFSVRDPADNGSIIDFDQRRNGGTLGDVRKRLREWHGGVNAQTIRPPASSYVERLEPVVTDHAAVRAAYDAAQPVESDHPYLTTKRGLPAALLVSERLAGRVRIDDRGNALFPHWNADKLICGFEIKNDGFTGFSPGGTKGLWCSSPSDQDRRLVIAETAIDALSYAVLFGHEDARFFSISGQMNPSQPGLLNRAIRAMPSGSQIIAAVDHDDGGQMIAEYLEPIIEHVRTLGGRDDLTFTIDHPPTAGDDWNDVLRAGTEPTRVSEAHPEPRPLGQ